MQGMWQALRARTTRAAIVLLVAGFGVAACGGDDDSAGGEGPAAVAPADTAIYVEAAVRPEEEDAEAIEAIAARFLGDDEELGDAIITVINDSFAEETGGELTYEEDVEPWLGQRAGVFITDPVDLEEGTSVPVAVEVTDEDAAREFIDSGFATSDEPERQAEYAGVSFIVGSDESALGVFEGFLVAAPSEERMRELIDVATGEADSLAGSEGFAYEAGDLAGDEAIGFARLDPRELVDFAVAADPAPEVTTDQVNEIAGSIGLDFVRAITLALAATPDTARLDATVPIVAGSYPESGSTELLGSLPADALLAGTCLACVDSVAEIFQLGIAEAAAEDGLSEEEALRRIEDQTGLDLEALRGALGGVAYFAGGRTPAELDGAVVIEVEDEAAVSDGLESLTLLAQGILSAQPGGAIQELPPLPGDPTGFTVRAPEFPVPIHVALTGDRLVVALGDNAAEQAIDPDETLASSGTLEDAESTLGGADFDPNALLDLDRVFDLARTFAGPDPDFREAEPYLDPFKRLVGGARVDGDELVSSIVVTFE
jgi:Protein of unknown function (DUF3352)